MKLRLVRLLITIIILIFPSLSLASDLIFTEVLYDAEGSDTKKEYIEIKNTTDQTIDLTGYKFCDSGKCHKLVDGFGNDFNLSAQAYGVLTQQPDSSEFKNTYPDFSGFILKTSLSLKNSEGELLELKNNDTVLDSFTYNPETGGKDGNSLSLIDGTWQDSQSTPGEINKTVSGLSSNDGNGDENNSDSSSNNESGDYEEISDMFHGQKKLHAAIDDLPTIVTGAIFEITGRAYGLEGVEIKGIDFLWNLGDGTKDHGQKITHEYYFPGEYLVSLIVKSSGFTSPTVTKKVVVIDPPLEISTVDFDKKYIEIKNNSTQTLNIQDWILMVDGEKFTIPENTYIVAQGVIKFSQRNTLLQIKPENRIFMLYPNLEKFQEYVEKSEENENVIEEKKEKEENIIEKNTKISTSSKTSQKTVSKKRKKAFQNKKSISKKKTKKESKLKITKNENKLFDASRQSASILPLKNKKDSFVQENLIEISFISFLILLLGVFFYFRSTTSFEKGKIEELSKEFEIDEK